MENTRTSVRTKLTEVQTKQLVEDFLYKLGEKLRIKRTRINLTQTELANSISMSQSEISKIENGQADANVSILPLYSVYCNFPMYELFPRDESQAILDSFSKAVAVTAQRKKRQLSAKQQKESIDTTLPKKTKSEKVLKARIYDVDGEEVYEGVPESTSGYTMREQYRDASIYTDADPVTAEEFCQYARELDQETIDSTVYAGRLLFQFEMTPRKETMKGMLADYIVDEILITPLLNSRKNQHLRLYAYYKKLYDMEFNGSEVQKE